MEPAAAERLGIPKARDMVFNVLSKRLETEDRSEVLAEGASLEVISRSASLSSRSSPRRNGEAATDGGTATTFWSQAPGSGNRCP
jgi:hypothetical protein